MKDRICCIFNYAPHYRYGIFKLMDESSSYDQFFGNKPNSNVEKINYSEFKFVTELNTEILPKKFYWIRGSISLAFKPYKKYLITGQINTISNWFFLAFAKIMGKDVYIWNHGWYGKEKYIKKCIIKFYYSFVTGFFLYGNYAKQLMLKEGFKENRLNVIYNSLSYNEALQIRDKLIKTNLYKNHFDNDLPVIVFIGRFQPQKKLHKLLKTIINLRQNRNPVNLVMVGDGYDKKRLEEYTKLHKITNSVWFYGPCYDEQLIGELIYNADVCVSPGNVGLTAIHSLTYGTPVITHNNFSNQMPEFEAIEKGITGDFFEEENIKSLQNTIENWLSKHPVKDDQLIKACYKRIDDFYNPNYQIQVLKSVLQQ